MTDPSDSNNKNNNLETGAVPPAGAGPIEPAAPAEAATPGGAGTATPVTEPAAAETSAPAPVAPAPAAPAEATAGPAEPPLDPLANQQLEAAGIPADEFPEAAPEGSCDVPLEDSPALDFSKAVSITTAPDPTGVTPVVGVKFQRACKTYFFNSSRNELKIGDHVIVETDRGLGLARVVTPVVELLSDKVTAQLKRVIRKAHWNDLERDRKNRERETEALKLCRDLINTHGLPMKLVRVEYLHDASKAVFFFTAESRVDFRELVKDLARQLHTRIEMRQIGVRDESKIVGGIGPCGREICCSTFLTDFVPVSVRMAKDQNLAMNPGKVSGLCGRLMCCLSYEHQLYRESVKKMPKKGKTLRCDDGPCRVIDLNILGAKVLVELESGKTMFVPASELRPLDQMEPNPNAEPREPPEEPAERGDNDALLDSDDPNALAEGSAARPRPEPPRDRPRREDQPAEVAPRQGQPPRRDDRRRDGRRDQRARPGQNRPGDRPADRPGQDRQPQPQERQAQERQPQDRPLQDRGPRPNRPQPPPSTVPYTGRQRPPAASPRSDRPEGRRDDRRDQRPAERPEERRDRPESPPPQLGPGPDGQPGAPAAPADSRPHHHNRRRRKNH